MKAILNNAGRLGGKYDGYVNFTLDELTKYIALYLFHGLLCSPQVEMKFHSSSTNPVNGNDFIHRAFGGLPYNLIRHHKHFKAFFASVNPRILPPDREKDPNFKVGPIIKHKLKVSKEAIHLRSRLSCDEQTVGFQGTHKDKQRITYKKEGDGFLADCLCSYGYTYAFHFRHVPGSQRLTQTCSPLHARVLGLISHLPHKNYTLGMDNLYMSAKLCRLTLSMPQKVMCHGVTRPSLRGVPQNVKQTEVSRKKEMETV